MKIEIDVKEWWTLSYKESYQTYDQRDGQYTAWRDKVETFLTEEEASNRLFDLQALRRGDKKIQSIMFSHIQEL